MSGVAVILAKLKAHAPLLAVVPTGRIMAGDFPENIALPAISVMQVSSVPRNRLSMNPANVMHTDTVQVTVIVSGIQGAAGTGYAGLRQILKLVLAACPHTHGTVASINVDSILPDSEGPDLPIDAPAMLVGSRDFKVVWTAT